MKRKEKVKDEKMKLNGDIVKLGTKFSVKL